MSAPRLFLIAGEASGDALGAGLMAGLEQLAPGTRFQGVGGPLMEQQGLSSLFPMSDLSVMGLAEILPRLPRLLARIRQTAQAVIRARPDALVTIDSPDFTLRVAARARRALPGLKVIHYVAPTVWAWRPERARKMAAHVDHVLALFPFEPAYMEAAGMGCDFVGHPVATAPRPEAGACAAFRAERGIAPDTPLLLVLPGSRPGEAARLLPVFRAVAHKVAAARPDVRLLIPAARAVAGTLALDLPNWPAGTELLDPRGRPPAAAEAAKRTAFAAADLALAASGTVSLELAAADTPMVIAYRFNALTTWMIRRKVRLDTATLVNILTDSRVVPEYLFEACTAERIAPEVLALLADPARAEAQRRAFGQAMALLGAGGEPAGLSAARAVLSQLGRA